MNCSLDESRGWANAKRRLVLALSLLLVTGAAAYFQFFFNPLGIGILRSSQFSWEKFENIKAGQPIEEVIETLGTPIREPEGIEFMNSIEGTSDPCSLSPCKVYRFLGRSDCLLPGAGYREAIIVVGPDGKVMNTVVRNE